MTPANWVWHVGELIVLGLGVGYVVSIYNGLVGLRQNIDKAWANIDVLLKQRHDELSKLLEVCRGYQHFERSVLESVARARDHALNAQSSYEKVETAGELSLAVRGLLARAEAYPDLKAHSNFLQLQKRVSDLEDQIADRREFYNDCATLWNIRIRQFPDVLMARALGMIPRRLYRVEASDRADVSLRM